MEIRQNYRAIGNKYTSYFVSYSEECSWNGTGIAELLYHLSIVLVTKRNPTYDPYLVFMHGIMEKKGTSMVQKTRTHR